MKRISAWIGCCLALSLASCSDSGSKPRVVITTSMGKIVVELEPTQVPKTVENFLRYVDDGFYDGTIFHRVMPDFMIQGGGFEPSLAQKPTRKPIKNEAMNGLRNDRGTIAMARTNDPHSATAQFYINVVDNDSLNHPGQSGWGYCAFGRVVEGMDVVDKIRAVPTIAKGPRFGNLPKEAVLIKSIKRQ